MATPTFESITAEVLKLPHAAKQRLSDWLHGHLAAADPGPAGAPAAPTVRFAILDAIAQTADVTGLRADRSDTLVDAIVGKMSSPSCRWAFAQIAHPPKPPAADPAGFDEVDLGQPISTEEARKRGLVP